MPASRRRLSRCLVIASLLAGCTGGVPTNTPKPGKGTKGGTAVENPLVPPGTDTPPVVSAGGGIISDQAASLSGTITAPAGIISSNGAGIISGNTGNYRVLSTLAQQPLGLVTVQLVDASGTAVKGADGKVLTAQTDAQGHYRFTGMLPSRNLIVQVDLGAKGTLQAVVPKDTAHDKVDADLISTLTTRYILDQYVATQTDKLATFDRLPGAVEADTRAKALTAFSGGTAAMPDALTQEAVLATVTSLRASDKAFDGQMAYVRSLLIIGQSDLGNGRPASEVSFGVMRSLVVLPNGDVAVSCPEQSRVWRITPQGIANTIAGIGTADLGSIDGKPGPQAGIFSPTHLMVDASGHLIILENTVNNEVLTAVRFPSSTELFSRVSRVEADGTLTVLWPNVKPVNMAVPLPTGEVLVFTTHLDGEETPVEAWAIAPDKTRTLKHSYTAAESALINTLYQYGLDASGMIHFTTTEFGGAEQQGVTVHYGIDSKTFALKRVGPAPSFDDVSGGLGNIGWPMVGPLGEAFHLEGDAPPIRLMADRADGVSEVFSEITGDVPYLINAFRTGPKAGYVLLDDGLYKVTDGHPTLVAGFSQGGSQAGDVTLLNPQGVAVRSDGTLFIADGAQIKQIAPNGAATVYAGGTADEFVPGPAANASLQAPSMVGLDSHGALYVLEGFGHGIRKLDAAGLASTAYAPAGEDEVIDQMVVAPDGTLYFSQYDDESEPFGLYRLPPGGTPTVIDHVESGSPLSLSDTGSDYALATDAAGALYVANWEKLRKWTPQDGFTDVATGDAWSSGFKDCAGMAIDAKGRCYLADLEGNAIVRFNPATQVWDVPAGKGGQQLNGTTVDQSLVSPNFPAFGPTGDLYIPDAGHKQVKRIPAGSL